MTTCTTVVVHHTTGLWIVIIMRVPYKKNWRSHHHHHQDRLSGMRTRSMKYDACLILITASPASFQSSGKIPQSNLTKAVGAKSRHKPVSVCSCTPLSFLSQRPRNRRDLTILLRSTVVVLQTPVRSDVYKRVLRLGHQWCRLANTGAALAQYKRTVKSVSRADDSCPGVKLRS